MSGTAVPGEDDNEVEEEEAATAAAAVEAHLATIQDTRRPVARRGGGAVSKAGRQLRAKP
jgi:hypothetical protein